jgi:Ca2+-transporting ATPase
VVHSVTGRARFEVAGLYGSPRLKKKLERRLRQVEGIRIANSNLLTGRLLVIFDAKLPIDDIIDVIEDQLADGRAPTRPANPRYQPPRSFNLFSKLESLFNVLPILYPSGPAFAATSGAQQSAAQTTQTQETRPWHLMEASAVLTRLATSEHNGLSHDEAGIRLQRFGANSLEASQRRSDLSIFVGQFNSLPVGLLGVSAMVSVMTGGTADAAIIVGVVLINSVIGFVTERQAEITISSLADTGVRRVPVVRNGQDIEVPVEQIVPGDVLLLTPGTCIAADIRLLNAHRLSVDESALTGESLPVTKDHEFLANEETALADRRNMSYMGTHITGGTGRGVVIATAKATELGQIQIMVGEAEAPDTPMQKQLDHMGTQLALLSGGVCLVVFGVGLLRGFGWLEMLRASVSLAVAAVPEGLPAVATTTLAMGIKDMRSRNVAVRHLDAVESLGSVQIFCLDKTGTLTMNRMAVVSVYSGGETFSVTDHQFMSGHEVVAPTVREELFRLMQIVSLCSETTVDVSDTDPRLEGSPTENALVELAIDAGIDIGALRAQYPKVRTRHRAEGRPYMTTLHSPSDRKSLLAVKGSPEEVLALCDYQIRDGKRVRLTKKARQQILDANEHMARGALRVLAVAYRELEECRMPKKTTHLIWLGLAGMADPMRPGMDDLIAEFHRAGIETVMITGDQSATAYAIGSQLGLSGGRALQVLESNRLEHMDPELLAGLVKNVHVFARVSPAHKLKIVRALQEAGYVVAMTGDGINDGPALKASDIGVAMGSGGTDIARSVSDVVLEDDNLQTMSIAVRQGRTIYNNIRKTVHFMISTNLTEIEVMLTGIALGLGQPLTPMQLLWINLITDIFPGLALSLEPAEPDIMDRPPRDPEEQIISRQDLKRVLFESATIGAGTMAAFVYGLRRYGAGAPQASTLAFTTLTVNELAHAFSSRSHHRVLFSRRSLRPNPHLNRAIIGMLGAQALATWVPGLRRLLGTVPIGMVDLLVVAAGVLLPLLVNEASKPALPEDIDEPSSETETGNGGTEHEEAA